MQEGRTFSQEDPISFAFLFFRPSSCFRNPSLDIDSFSLVSVSFIYQSV